MLYSGGLDSILAAKVLLEQNIQLSCLHFLLPFFPPHEDPQNTRAAQLASESGLEVEYIRTGSDYMNMLKNPAYGYGKNMNPCVDCKIFFLRHAAEKMIRENYDFVATGEVLGQRPMSQLRNKLNLIEKESGLRDNLLRPLSAKFLKPIKAERDGLIDRERLLDISGRGRSRQFELAAKFGITEYQSPAGGCLFTDVTYSSRLKDLLMHHPAHHDLDIYLLSIGRHYRLSSDAKIIISRNAEETQILQMYSEISDTMLISRFKGPVGFIRGIPGEKDIKTALSMIYRHGKPDADKPGMVTIIKKDTETEAVISSGLPDSELDIMRIQ